MEMDCEKIALAFGKQAPRFDMLEEKNEILKEMRKRVRNRVMPLLAPRSGILELNAGTGLDAVYFASRGHHVTATDISEGMINELSKKAVKHGLEDFIHQKVLSYKELHVLEGEKYNLIFSNFGGLNCTASLEDIFSQFPRLLLPGGYVCLVMMPAICPWEISYCLRGKPGLGLRRFKKKGTMAHLEGIGFITTYYSPSRVKKAFPPGFRQISLSGLGAVMPPPYMENFPLKWPGVFRLLKKLDREVENIPPFNSWADHFLLVMQLEK